MDSIRPIAYGGGIDTRDPMKAPDGSNIVFQDPLQADFLGIPIDQKYVFGKADLPSTGQIIRGVLSGIVDPLATGSTRTQDKIQQEIDTRNDMVMKRAEILTYYDQVLGYHIPRRVAVAGVGGKAAKVLVPKAVSIDIPEIPNMFMFFPTSTVIRPPEMSGWSNEQIVGFAMDNGPNGYAVYLNNGGEPIDIVDEVVQKVSKDPKHAEKVKEVRSIKAKMQPWQDKLEEEKVEFEADDDMTPEATAEEEKQMDEEITQFILDYEEELANMPADSTVEEINLALDEYADIQEFEKEYKVEIDNLAKWKIYNKMTAGMGYSNKAGNNAKTDIYKTKGGQQWIDDYMKKNGQPKTAEDTQRMRDAWSKSYPAGDPKKPSADYPAVPTYVKPAPKPTGRVPDAANQQRPSSSTVDPDRPTNGTDTGGYKPSSPTVDPERPPRPADSQPPKPQTPPEQLLSQREIVVTEMIRRGMSLEDAVRTYDYVVDNNLTFSLDPKKQGDVNFDPITGKISGIPDTYQPDPTSHKDDPVITITTDPTTGQRTATANPERPPDGHGGEEEKKAEGDDKKTSTSSPEDDPDFSRTKIDTGEPSSKDDGKTKPKPIPPIIPPVGPDVPNEPPKQPRRPKLPDDDDPDDPDNINKADGLLKGQYKRPEMLIGGQDVLTVTGRERLEEIENWDLFDIPIPENADPANPLFLQNRLQDKLRYYHTPYINTTNVDSILRTNHEQGGYTGQIQYNTPVRRYQPPSQIRMLNMEPIMKATVGRKTPFRDPYERRQFNMPNTAFRHLEGEQGEILDRMGNIYPDYANQLAPIPEYAGHPWRDDISVVDLMMSQK